ncbi:hypothetical protein QFC22_003023 [Naganishia vaughanmartiniae]|uniref:Uncharacterized protein n=1 Tax=Naganishia vaughanmartiniae TaxID=1424756 RepID=A0ACC2X953_9TREE|nr:hypothetical protein QFC22_003023 [Naganishia vaughanmartiniae]
MSYNNAFLIKSIAHQAKPESTLATPVEPFSHTIEPSNLVLPTALPLTKELELEARAVSAAELVRQSEELERERQLAEALQEEHQQEERKQVVESQGSWVRLIAGKRKGKQKAEEREEHRETKAFDRPPNAYELYAAIDRKDIMYIMRVRDTRQLIVLPYFAFLDATSYVNHLDESDFQKKETIGVLRQLRLNLKLAIDNSLLPESDPSLLSSYLQVLIMSEGDVWLHKAVHEVSLAIRLSPYIIGTELDSSSGPVHRADSMVRDFCTKELRNVQGGTFGVEAYIANAVMDLVIMATWSLIIEQIPEAEPLPTYSFARDQRTYSLFVEATEKYHLRIAQKTQKRLKALKNLLIEVCGETHVTIKERVSMLRKQIDGEGGDKAK